MPVKAALQTLTHSESEHDSKPRMARVCGRGLSQLSDLGHYAAEHSCTAIPEIARRPVEAYTGLGAAVADGEEESRHEQTLDDLLHFAESAEHWIERRGPQAVCEDLVRFIALLSGAREVLFSATEGANTQVVSFRARRR
jgi:hypothetical protein